MNKQIKYGLPLAAAILLIGCGGSSSNNDSASTPEPEIESVQKFTQNAQWIIKPTAGSSACFDFDNNAETTCEGTAWDMKLSLGAGSRDSAKFYTNSGPTTTGKGGALGDPFNFTWEELQSMKDTSTAPSGDPLLGPMFMTDSMQNGFSDEGVYGAFEYANQKILSKHSVYLITLNNAQAYDASSNDTYAVQLTDYYGGTTGSISGYPKVRFISVADASNNHGNVQEKQVNASSDWTYLNLKTSQEVNKTDEWHIGFNRYNLITNSGESGTGTVGSFNAQTFADFYGTDGKIDTSKLSDAALITDAKKMLTNNADWATPTAAKDWQKDTLVSALNPAYQGSVMTGLDYGFYSYTGMNADHPAGTHKFVANPENGVLLRSGDGKSYARVHLTNIVDGQYTFDFDVAPAK